MLSAFRAKSFGSALKKVVMFLTLGFESYLVRVSTY